MKKLVIFDLDGTLIDSAKGLMDSMNCALDKLNLPNITLEETKKYIGNGSLMFAKRSAKDDGELAEKCHNLFLEDYNKKASKVTPLYDGVEKLLKKLNKLNVKIAILSNKPQSATQEICNNLFKGLRIDYISGHKEGMALKPSTDGVEEILTALKVDHKDSVLIGDGETDAQTAVNAGIDFIGVLWGFRTKKQIKEGGGRCFAKKPDDLLNMILYRFGKNRVFKLFGEFKAFITKGNVLDMAVGVVVGASFTAIVNSLVKDVITPVVSLVTGGVSLTDLKFVLREAEVVGDKIVKPALTLNYGMFIQAVINFLLIALTVFVFIKVVVTIRKKLDYNENMKENIQQKLDFDEPLNKLEQRWMTRQKKKHSVELPRKTVIIVPEPPKPAPPPEPQLTDKLLMEILEEMKKNNNN